MATIEEIKKALSDHAAKSPEIWKELSYRDEKMEAEATAYHADYDYDGTHYVVNVWDGGITISSGADILLEDKEADVTDLRSSIEATKTDTKATALDTFVAKVKEATTAVDVKPAEELVEEVILKG